MYWSGTSVFFGLSLFAHARFSLEHPCKKPSRPSRKSRLGGVRSVFYPQDEHVRLSVRLRSSSSASPPAKLFLVLFPRVGSCRPSRCQALSSSTLASRAEKSRRVALRICTYRCLQFKRLCVYTRVCLSVGRYAESGARRRVCPVHVSFVLSLCRSAPVGGGGQAGACPTPT